MIKKYRKKPCEVEALRWNGTDLMELNHFVEPGIIVDHGIVYIPTISGKMRLLTGNYVAKNRNGEYYIFKPSMFEELYEAVEKQHRKNAEQEIKKYSAIEPDKVIDQIAEDARYRYVGWKIISMSIVNNEHGLFYGFVVYEKI